MSDQTLIVLLLTFGAFGLCVAVILWNRGSTLASELRFLHAEQFDPAQGSLPAEAIPMHLGPELVRSRWNGTPVVLLAICARGIQAGTIGRIVRSTMRVDETCYDLDRSTVLVSLRGTSFALVEPALRRFAIALQASGARGIEVGASASPAHGSEVSQLVALAASSSVPVETVLAHGPQVLIDSVQRRRSRTGITLASVWFLLLWIAALGALTSVSQHSSRLMPLLTAAAVAAVMLIAGFIQDYRVPFASWSRKSRRVTERERGVSRPRGELLSGVVLTVVLVGSAAGALAMSGRDARLMTDVSIIASASVVGVLGGRFFGAVASWVAIIGGVLIAAGVVAWWTVLDPGANDVAAWTIAACATGVVIGSLAATVVRRPIVVAGLIVVAAVAASALLEVGKISTDVLEIHSYVYIWTPGGVIRSGAGLVGAAAAFGALVAMWRMPLMRVAMSCAIGASGATIMRWVDGFSGAPASAFIALSALALLGPVFAGRTTRSLKS